MKVNSKILIVDDSSISREGLRGALALPGYILEFANDGPSALEKAAEFDPDLILLDVMMPEMDGFEVCRRLRDEPRTAEVPIILITALDDKASLIKGIEAGADDFLGKPFDRVELRARVKTITRLNRYGKLTAERSKLETLVDLSPDGILVVSGDATILMANKAFESMVRAKPGEVRGNSLFSFIAKEQQQHCGECFEDIMAGKGSRTVFASTFVEVDGRQFPVEIAASVLEWDDQPAAELIVRDISDRVSLENQLRQAQKLETIGQLTAGLAHDFNNILSVISSNAELQPPTADGSVRDIVAAAKSGAVLIRKLMGLSRQAHLELQPVSLTAITTDLEPILSKFLPKTVSLRLDLEEHRFGALADAGAVQQILMNLTTNARDAMPEGGTLTITTVKRTVTAEEAQALGVESDGEFIGLAVTDTGTGMDEEIVSKIFEPFFTTKDTGKGTGLGMAMMAGLMKQHGGFVSIDSKVGAGTSIEFYFKRTELPATAGADPEVGDLHGTGTILVVDDEPALRRTSKRVLEKFGYRVLLAEDGAAAQDLFIQNSEDIDLVISDLEMPGVSGVEFHENLRARDFDVPFLFSSGRNSASLADLLAAHEKSFFMSKPWTLNELGRKVKEAMNG